MCSAAECEIKPIYNIDAILGYEVFPHLLPFVEAGVSFANVNSNNIKHNAVSNLASGTIMNYSTALNFGSYKTGYNVGLGSNYQLSRNWFLSSEIIYNYLGKNSASRTVNLPDLSGSEAISTSRTFQLVSLLASVSYLFPV